jgi:hypothetical protein
MNLPPDLRDLGTDGVIQVFMRQVREQMVDNNKFPSAGEINDFFPLVHKCIISKQRTENIADDKMVLFVEEDPPEKLDTETITFFIQSRSPGQWAQGPAGTSSHKEVRFHVRNVTEHPEHPGEKIVTSGKFYDNYIRFNVYSKTNKQARKRLLWFTQLMDQYLWYFALSGFKVIERGVGDRSKIEIKEYGKVTMYPITYYVKSEELVYTGTQELKQVVLSLDTEKS